MAMASGWDSPRMLLHHRRLTAGYMCRRRRTPREATRRWHTNTRPAPKMLPHLDAHHRPWSDSGPKRSPCLVTTAAVSHCRFRSPSVGITHRRPVCRALPFWALALRHSSRPGQISSMFRPARRATLVCRQARAPIRLCLLSARLLLARAPPSSDDLGFRPANRLHSVCRGVPRNSSTVCKRQPTALTTNTTTLRTSRHLGLRRRKILLPSHRSPPLLRR